MQGASPCLLIYALYNTVGSNLGGGGMGRRYTRAYLRSMCHGESWA